VDAWAIGSQAVVMPPGTNGPASAPFALPQPNNTSYPSAWQYQGQVAQRSQHVRTAGDGRILFFAIDGNLYDGDGYLIADARPWGCTSGCCTECLEPGVMEFISLPVPGSCNLFYLFSAAPQSNFYNGTHVQWSILDLDAENPRFPPQAPATCARKGRLLNFISDPGSPAYPQLNAVAWEPEDGIFGVPSALTSEHVCKLSLGSLSVQAKTTTPLIRAVEGEDGAPHWLFYILPDRVYVYKVMASGVVRVNTNPGASLPAQTEYVPLLAAATVVHNKRYIRDADAIRSDDPSRSDDPLVLAIADVLPMIVYPVATNSYDVLVLRFDPYTGSYLSQESQGFTVQAAGCSNGPATGVVGGARGCALRADGHGLYLTGETSTDCQNWTPFVRHIELATEAVTDLTYAFGGTIDPEWTRTRIYRNKAPNNSGWAIYFPAATTVAALTGLANLNAVTFDPAALTGVAVPQYIPVPAGSGNAQFEPRFLNIGVAGDRYLSAENQAGCCTFLQTHGSGMVYGHRQSPGMAPNTWTATDNPYNNNGPLTCVCDLVVEGDAQLNLNGMEIRFAPGVRTVVQRKGVLDVFDTKLTSLDQCPNTRWLGIEVRGIISELQTGAPYPTEQGYLALRASTVQNAEIGVLVAKRGLLGNLASGGVVLADRAMVTSGGSTAWKRTEFRNCKVGVQFPAYLGYTPSGALMANRSRFSDCLFTVDTDYPAPYDFRVHANLHRVTGIQFRACQLENTIPDAFFDMNGDFPGSQYLGHGIRSMDAHFSVSSPCNQILPVGQPCPEPDTRFSEFRGLDHGIHATNAGSPFTYQVNNVRFTDNIAGVYSSAVHKFSVRNSTFSIGGREVELTNLLETNWNNHHRGIYSHSGQGFTVQDNTLFKTPGSAEGRLTEGVVIGYSGASHDMVFRNHGAHLSVGFAGEGVSASLVDSETPVIGLELLCNTNNMVDKNLSSRKANGEPAALQASHIIRTFQGDPDRPADNQFDNWPPEDPDRKDYEVTTTYSPISYWCRAGAPYLPVSYDPYLNPALVDPQHINTCANRIHRFTKDSPEGLDPAEAWNALDNEKLAYGSVRYLYEQLIDGGNTSEVVQEITDAWPQDVWDLRASLLARSPFLSTEVLRELNVQNKLPAPVYAEVCIANPDATRADRFFEWLEHEAPHPLPQYLMAAIAASWSERTYRTTLEGSMANRYAAYSQLATLLLEYHSSNEEQLDLTALRSVWQELRTPSARFAEAITLMEQGQYAAATAVVEAIPQEHSKLKPRDITEKDRMLALIAFRQDLAASGRSDAELTMAEQDHLESLINGQQDRPAMWMQNLLCFHYDRCAAPWTGEGGTPKSLPQVKPELPAAAPPVLALYPNPATTWAVATLELPAELPQARLRVLDLAGKQLHMQVVPAEQPQLVLDTRRLAPGAYLVEVADPHGVLATEKLIVQP
jgi:hypothetical protein